MIKKTLLLLSFLFISILALAETASPSYGVKLERYVDIARIENKTYFNVIVEVKAADIDDVFRSGVKITVKDANNPKKKIFKKRFSKSFLYGFSDGALQVGNGNALTQLILNKKYGNWNMTIREKGIY